MDTSINIYIYIYIFFFKDHKTKRSKTDEKKKVGKKNENVRNG